MNVRLVLAIAVVLLLAGNWQMAVTAQQRPTLPSQEHAVLPADSVSLESLTSVDGAALRTQAQSPSQRDEIRPYQFGHAIDTDFTPNRHGTWEQLPSGGWLWRLRIQSDGAVSLNLGFTSFQLPDGATLFVRDPNRDVVHGPYTQEDATNGQLWTPVVRGSELVIELEVPEGTRSDISVDITQVSHGFRSLRETRSQGATTKARACNIDVACSKADPWRNQVKSVATYSVFGTDLCSGSLINNTSGDGTPYFLTAEHCIQGSESRTTSMVFYWNYQNPTCRPPGSSESGTITSDDKFDQTSSGALLRMSYGNCEDVEGRRCELSDFAGKSDVTLVEIDDPIPATYNLFLSGWDRSDFAPSSAVSIHHPRNHGKRITFENDPTVITGISSSSGDTHFEIDWDEGTTEGGSSGGPLFSPSKKIVGVLSGGGAGCNITDYYGRIHDAWTGGGTPDTRLRDWLDPNNTGAQKTDGQPLVAPPPVSELNVTNVTSDSATLEWEAPADDPDSPAPSTYDLRLQPDSSIDAADFDDARKVSNVPAPASPGTAQSVTVSLNQNTSYFFAIRTLDATKNASPIVSAERDATPVSTLQVKQAPSPNPTGSKATVKVSVEASQTVKMTVYDILGRRVGIEQRQVMEPFRLEAIHIDVSSLSSGVYFVRLEGRSTTRTEKIVVKR